MCLTELHQLPPLAPPSTVLTALRAPAQGCLLPWELWPSRLTQLASQSGCTPVAACHAGTAEKVIGLHLQPALQVARSLPCAALAAQIGLRSLLHSIRSAGAKCGEEGARSRLFMLGPSEGLRDGEFLTPSRGNACWRTHFCTLYDFGRLELMQDSLTCSGRWS
jgi:hypothetical protein